MLNELLIIERGVPRDEIEQAVRHDDIQETAQGVRTLHIRLNAEGHVADASPVPDGVRLWTLRNHNKNSFPFVQVKPLLDDTAVKRWEDWRKENPRPKPHELRAELLWLGENAELRRQKLGEWATKSVMTALRRRLSQIETLKQTDAVVLPIALTRFLQTCDLAVGGPLKLLEAVRASLLEGMEAMAGDAWLNCAAALLVAGKGALYIDADGEWPCGLTDRKIIAPVSAALENSEKSSDAVEGLCALAGKSGRLVSDTFPRADLPTIGPTILFARFHGRPANERYGRFGCDSIAVGEALARRLAAAAKVLTVEGRRNVTWRPIPGEKPKQSDLLLAFIETAIDARLAEAIAEDDFAEETPESAAGTANSIAAFEKRTERLIEAVRAKVGADFRQTPVRLAVFRRLDQANRKVVYAGAPTVAELYEAAAAWAAGERNVPPWLTLPILVKGRKVVQSEPSHIAPLGMIDLSKQIFLRSGERPKGKKKEQVGLPAAEAIGLFLESDRRRVGRVLRLMLTRRAALLTQVAHTQHTPECWERRSEVMNKLDRREALRTVTLLGVLLHKLGRKREDYMSDTAFKLGQLLAAADVVHAGYCADVRGGDVPPSLLGNQVFTTAQTAPVKALAILCRRWKPYGGWASKAARERSRADAMIASKKREEEQRGWDIKIALRHAREVKPLADQLASALAGCVVDDAFRAELLLGYIAGLPKAERRDADDDNNEPAQITKQEN